MKQGFKPVFILLLLALTMACLGNGETQQPAETALPGGGQVIQPTTQAPVTTQPPTPLPRPIETLP